FGLMQWVEPEPALAYALQAVEYAQEHEVYTLASYAVTTVAWLRLRRGDWDEADRVARAELERNPSVFQPLAKAVLAEIAVRRGDPDADERLADLAAESDRTRELQRTTAVAELEIDRSLTGGGPMPV